MNTDKCIDICNKLLRGERSAVETYDNAIEKHGTHPGAGPELSRIRDEHVESIALLERNVRDMGGTPSTESGTWGNFASAIQSTANLFGADSALESLKAGEKHGLDEYQDALENDYVMIDCKSMMQTRLIPPIREHIIALDRLQEYA